MAKSGKNITPPTLAKSQSVALYRLCDAALCDVIRLYDVAMVIGVGKFASDRARLAMETGGILGVRVGTLMHPSPANPAANRGWRDIAQRQLQNMGVHDLVAATDAEEDGRKDEGNVGKVEGGRKYEEDGRKDEEDGRVDDEG